MPVIGKHCTGVGSLKRPSLYPSWFELPVLSLLLGLLLVLLSEVSLDAEGPKRLSFIPHWSPQAQFAGYFVAYEKGFYRQQGIDLNLITGDPRRPPTEALENGGVDFATMWLSTAIQRASEGVRILNLAQVIQRSSLMLVAKKARGITAIKDLTGKKVGVWGGDFRIQPEALFRKYGLAVKIVPQSYSINLFLRDGIDAASAMWYNEYHTMISAGLNEDELTTFFFADYGLNFPEDGIYVLERTFRQDPGLACAFARASMEGWYYAFDHPEEALGIVLKRMEAAKVPANVVHQRWMLNRMKDLILGKGGEKTAAGLLQKEDFETVAKEMKAQGLINRIPGHASFAVECIRDVRK
jgi:NitT/TauT family transport system substrate-binding protein